MSSRSIVHTPLFRLVMFLLVMVLCWWGVRVTVASFFSQVYVFRARQLLQRQSAASGYEFEAIAYRIRTYNPLDGYGRFYLGQFYERQERPADAVREYQAALRTISHPPLVLPRLASLQYSQGQLESAGSLYQRTLAMDPRPAQQGARTWLQFGLTNLRLRNAGEALWSFHRAERLGAPERLGEGERSELRQWQLTALLQLQLFLPALIIYQEWLEEGLPLSRVWKDLVEIGRRQDLLEELLVLLRRLQARGMVPQDLEFLPGLILDQQGKGAEAIDYLEEVVARDPDNRNCLGLLGDLYYKSGQQQQALETYERLVEVDPESPQRERIDARIKELRGGED